MKTNCIYCGREIEDAETVPSVSDNAAWDVLTKEHASGCEWVVTRAHRLDDGGKPVQNQNPDEE